MAGVYQIVPVDRLRRSEWRAVVLLRCGDNPALDAVAIFKSLDLDPARKRELLDRFDAWIDGAVHNNRWFHGFDRQEYRDCFVFKWKQKNRGKRLYGFLYHPQPHTRPRFELCVLTNHADKPHPQFETDPRELDTAKSLRASVHVRAAIMMAFPDPIPGAKQWKN
jgi:hypothetical protein